MVKNKHWLSIFTVVGLLGIGVFVSGCNRKMQPGALKVQAQPEASIMIDGQDVGKTPYSNENVEPGQITLKLVPTTGSGEAWEGLVDVSSGVVTVVNRNLAANAVQSAGEILTMEAINQAVASLAVVSDPDGAMVKVNGNALGPTPLDMNQVEAGDQQLTISAPGYAERAIPIKTQVGYKLIVNVKLAKQEVATIIDPNSEATPSAELTGTVTPVPSGKVSPSPTTSAKVTPTGTPKVTPGTGGTSEGKLKILATPLNNTLNVRAKADSTSEKVGSVNTGEVYDYYDAQSGWYKIEYETGKMGWISGQYAQKV